MSPFAFEECKEALCYQALLVRNAISYKISSGKLNIDLLNYHFTIIVIFFGLLLFLINEVIQYHIWYYSRIFKEQ